MKFLRFLKPLPHQKEIQDATTVKKLYRNWRLRIFSGMYFGYIFYYFSRKSLVIAMPGIIAATGFTKTDIGFLSTLLAITYGVSKFVSGIIADRSNPRYFMSIGLFLTGLSIFFFGLSSNFILFAVLICINGWFQGWGWPPCARQFTHWFSQKERGTWWGIWNTSHSIGISGIAIIGAFFAEKYGWRFAMIIPGILCICMSFFILLQMRDTPQSLGLPTIEKFKGEKSTEKTTKKKN